MASFTCKKGHTFDSSSKFRAFCPECGASTKREFSDDEPADEKPEPVQESADTEKESTDPKPTEEKEIVKEDKPEPESRPTKKQISSRKVVKVNGRPVKVGGGAKKKMESPKPVIKTKVVTNVEKKAAKEEGKKQTHWEKVRQVGWF